MITGGTPIETTTWGWVKPILNVKYDDDIEPNISTMDGKMEASKEEPHQKHVDRGAKRLQQFFIAFLFPLVSDD